MTSDIAGERVACGLAPSLGSPLRHKARNSFRPIIFDIDHELQCGTIW
jgi:hypothetical protein